MSKKPDIIEINRAPVLTLWVSIVAERMGYKHDEALSLGKAMAALTAQSKGRRLGIYKPKEKKAGEKRKRGEQFFVQLGGRPVPAVQTDEGVRAVAGAKPIKPEPVDDYLKRSFGADLDRVRAAMTALAHSIPPGEIEQVSFGLYEQFRPSIPGGTRGWGAKGELDLNLIRSLGKG